MVTMYNLQTCRSFDYGIFIWLLIILSYVSSTIEHDYMEGHRPEKQMSLESCLGRFDVHTNTIIRTGESQAIGGKFLQGLELETPEKCQRLCCETQDCDVYVFEEKNDGYCYLFECGSPKNFHCKFTRHPNYTSALITEYKSVLPTTPRPIPHVYLTNISTQEQELISLKLKPEKSTLSSTSPPVDVVTSENRLLAAPATESRNMSCGRFEFPCHSGECIAVYNACNGIPQCVDGSDEGPECSAANAVNPVKASIHHLENLKQEGVQQVPTYMHTLKKFQQTAGEPPFAENRGSLVSAPTVWLNQKVQADTQADLDRTAFGRKSSVELPAKHIINVEEPSEKQFPSQRDMYAQLPPIKSSFPTPQIAQPTAHVFAPNIRWPSQRQQWQIVNQGQTYSTQDQPPILHPEQSFPEQVDEQMANSDHRTPKDNVVLKVKPQSKTNYQEKNMEYTDYPEKAAESPKKPPEQPKHEVTKSTTVVAKEAPHPSVVEQYKMIEQHLEMKFTDHDGYSERPRGAVLSLTLGLLVTGIIVVLIGCRLRTVGRRGGRHGGKAAYAPDEDFLVNGMYL